MEQLPSDFYEVKFNQLEKRLIMDAFTIYTTVLLSLVVALVTDSYDIVKTVIYLFLQNCPTIFCWPLIFKRLCFNCSDLDQTESVLKAQLFEEE